jgi:hypothetical protein
MTFALSLPALCPLLRAAVWALLLLALSSGSVGAQESPFVLVSAERQECRGNSCHWVNGMGNGVVIEATSERLVVATAGHNVHQGRNVRVQINDTFHSATSHRSNYDSSGDFAVVIVNGDFSNEQSLRIYPGELPYGTPVAVHGYWPGQPRWRWRILNLFRQRHQRFGDSLSQPVVPGVSGAAVIHQGRVAGIVFGVDPPTLAARPTVTYFTRSPQMLAYMQHWGITINDPPARRVVPDEQIADHEKQNPIHEPPGSEHIADLGEPSPIIPDKPGGPVRPETEPVRPEPEPVAPIPPVKAAEQEPTESPVRGWVIGQLSSLAWAGIGAGVGGPAGVLLTLAVRRLKRGKGGDPVSTTHAKPHRKTDVGRERIVDISEQTRREFEEKIAELESNQSVEFRDINTDSGLRMMREAMSMIGKTYPQSMRWIQTIEAVYDQIRSGAKVNV